MVSTQSNFVQSRSQLSTFRPTVNRMDGIQMSKCRSMWKSRSRFLTHKKSKSNGRRIKKNMNEALQSQEPKPSKNEEYDMKSRLISTREEERVGESPREGSATTSRDNREAERQANGVGIRNESDAKE